MVWAHDRREVRSEGDRLGYLSGRRRRLTLRAIVAAYRPWIETTGLERLGRIDDPAIFALNHNNAFESIGVPATLIYHRQGRMIHFLVDWMFLHIPVVGSIMRQIEPVPIYTKPARWRLGESYRQSRRPASPVASAVATVRSGASVGVFPEGTRNGSAEFLLRGRAGLGRIVLETTAPVVPVGVRFTSAAERGRVPAIGHLTIAVGSPLVFAEERLAYQSTGGDDGRNRAAARDLGREIVDHVMTAVGELCGKRTAKRVHSRAGALPDERLQTIGGGA